MRYSAILSILMLIIGCGDDTKKAAASNVSSNNTTLPTPSANNTSTPNVPSNPNTSSSLELGNDDALISSLNVDACQLAQAYYDANVSKSDICTLTGLFDGLFPKAETDAEARMKCQSGYDACLAGPEMDGACVINMAGCDEKVSLLESCIETRTALVKVYAGGLTCSNLTVESELQDVADSEECALLETNCPAIFGE